MINHLIKKVIVGLIDNEADGCGPIHLVACGLCNVDLMDVFPSQLL